MLHLRVSQLDRECVFRRLREKVGRPAVPLYSEQHFPLAYAEVLLTE